MGAAETAERRKPRAVLRNPKRDPGSPAPLGRGILPCSPGSHTSKRGARGDGHVLAHLNSVITVTCGEGVVMDGWVGFVVVLAVWTVLQVWLLPRLGVPT